MAQSTITAAAAAAIASPVRRIESIVDLPLEIQTEIFKHTNSIDLISLSLVSKAFHDIAAANLYRNFYIIFPDDNDAEDEESPIDALASALDTYATSEYNYAQYLRDVYFDTIVGGEKAERAYHSFIYENSCGKFLSTLFVLTLRKAKALERFKWNIRVELSRPVFQALHRIDALKHLHLRLHSGYSLYEPPPPLVCESHGPSKHESHSHSLPQPPLPTSLFEQQSREGKLGGQNGSSQRKFPPTFSGFRGLRTLCILDMDTYEYLKEIQECIKNSSGTLNKLRLSFSESLANQARKAVVENEDEDSDTDDAFPPIPHPAGTSSTPVVAKVMEEERRAQEAALSTIFGLDSAELVENEQSDKEEQISGKELHKSFIDEVRYHLSRLCTAVHGPGSRINLQKDVLDAVTKATTKYTEAELEKNGTDKTSDGEGNVAQDTSEPSDSVAEDHGLNSSLFGTTNEPKKDNHAINPEEFDIESPEAGDFNDWEATEEDYQDEESPVSEAVVEDVPDVSMTDVSEPDGKDVMVSEDSCVEELSSTEKDNQMREYTRETRGLALKTLAIYLIPIKASVLSRAIDFRVLIRITLLNVGAQSPLWTLLSKMNKTSPLPLSEIFTDNVTLPFLNLVSELDRVTELLMLERSSNRPKVESSTTKTTVTREQIRALALRKHAKSLRKLMIKNENDYSWDVSEKTIRLLCAKGKFLEELAVSCGIKSIHTLFQNISGLRVLKALHIISFRAEDTCVFVVQELRRFAIDIMSCHPQHKLEYIGLGSALAQITRFVKKSEAKAEGKKEKSKAKSFATLHTDPLSPIDIDGFGLSDSESDYESDGGIECGNGVKLKVSESIRFSEVEGVRIFMRDAVHGRL